MEDGDYAFATDVHVAEERAQRIRKERRDDDAVERSGSGRNATPEWDDECPAAGDDSKRQVRHETIGCIRGETCEDELVASRLAHDEGLRRLSDDARCIHDGDGADAGESNPRCLKGGEPVGTWSTRPADPLTVERELSERGVAGRERLAHIARQDEREVLGAPIAGVQDLLSALPEVRAAETGEGKQDDRGRKPDCQLALAYRREPQISSEGTDPGSITGTSAPS
jgi:hypothetical protein